MAKRVIGLDIGSSSIKVVHFESREIVQSQEVKLNESAFDDLKKAGWFQGDFIVTGLGGVDAQVRSLEVPFSNSKKIDSVLGSLLDAQLPLEIEDLVVSWFLATNKSDEQQKILAAFAKRESVAEKLKELEAVEINPNILTLRSAALYELLKYELHEYESAELKAMVDLGEHSTTICVGNSKQLLLARSLLKSDIPSVSRELKQTLLSLDKPITGIFLVGGGALREGSRAEIERVLELPTRVLRPFSLSPTMALAVGYGLIGQTPHEKLNRFNLRKGEFAFRSRVNLISARTKNISIWAGVLLALLILNYSSRLFVLGSQVDSLIQAENKLCQQVVGKTKSSSKRANCLSLMKKAIAQDKQEQIPKLDSIDIYLEVSKDLPNDLKLKLTELDIGNGGVRMTGEIADFESIDKVVSSLQKGRCFKNIEKGRARQVTSGVSFQISMDIACTGAGGQS